jgi:hypothetical protein
MQVLLWFIFQITHELSRLSALTICCVFLFGVYMIDSSYLLIFFLLGFCCGLGVKMDKERNKYGDDKRKKNIPMFDPEAEKCHDDFSEK